MDALGNYIYIYIRIYMHIFCIQCRYICTHHILSTLTASVLLTGQFARTISVFQEDKF